MRHKPQQDFIFIRGRTTCINGCKSRSRLTMDAELGLLPTFIDHQHHDEQEGASERSQTHSHGHLQHRNTTRPWVPPCRSPSLYSYRSDSHPEQAAVLLLRHALVGLVSRSCWKKTQRSFIHFIMQHKRLEYNGVGTRNWDVTGLTWVTGQHWRASEGKKKTEMIIVQALCLNSRNLTALKCHVQALRYGSRAAAL